MSKHSDPINLIKRLCDIGLGSFNHKDLHVPFIGETLLFDPGKIVSRDLRRFFVDLKRGIVGNAFAGITSSTLDHYDGRTGELETALSLSRNLVCIRFNDDLYVAKRPKRLVARKNKLITSLGKIFCVSRSSSIRDLYEGVKKTRNLRDEFPFEVFHEFVSRLDFFELNESTVSCLSPPRE